MDDIKIIELTKDNYKKYLAQVAGLEEKVLEKMETEGQSGQFFTTGYDDILEYILSEDNTVLVAIDGNDKVVAATYITEGQTPYTYNDITKYFKTGKDYSEWVKKQYSTDEEYKNDMLDAYKMKMEAYQYAKKRILDEYPQYQTIQEFLIHEIKEGGNRISRKKYFKRQA